MVCHCSGLFQRAAVFQIGCDAGCPECVIADPRFDASSSGPPADHRISVCLGEGSSGQQPRIATNGAEQWPLGVPPNAAAIKICLQVTFEVVVARHLMALAALLMQANPKTAVLHI